MTGLVRQQSDGFMGKVRNGFRLHGANYCIKLTTFFPEQEIRANANELMGLILPQKTVAHSAIDAAKALKIKIMTLGEDMMPSYLEHMYGKYFDPVRDVDLMRPAIIVERLLRDDGTRCQNTNHFLMMLPDYALISCSEQRRAFSLVVRMCGRETLLPYISRHARGVHLEDALGL